MFKLITDYMDCGPPKDLLNASQQRDSKTNLTKAFHCNNCEKLRK